MHRHILKWFRKILVVVSVFGFCGPIHAQVENATQDPLQVAQELMDKATAVFKEGKYAEAIPLIERATEIREKELGPDDPLAISTVEKLGRIYYFGGDFTRSITAYERALRGREKVFGLANLEAVGLMSNLGAAYFESGDYVQGELLMKRSLSIFEKSLDLKDKAIAGGFAGALTNLASFYFQTGDYAKAEAPFKRALAIREEVFGPDQALTGQAMSNLASLYKDTGDYAKAAALYEKALAIIEKADGPDHPNTASALNNVGGLYCAIGAYKDAIALYQRALAIREKTQGPTHPATGTVLENLADTLIEMGAYDEAKPYAIRSLEVREGALGPEHLLTAVSVAALANVYAGSGEYDRAEPLYQRALNIRLKILGRDHPIIAESYRDLAMLEWARGHLSSALALLRTAQSTEAKAIERSMLTGSETRKAAYLRSLANDTFRFVSFSVNSKIKGSAEVGLESVLQYKGRVLDAMSDSVARLRHSLSIRDRARFEQLAEIANQLSILTYQEPDANSADNYRKRVAELVARQEKVESELAERSGEFRRQVTRISVSRTRRAIPENTALIEWFRYKPLTPTARALQATQTKARYIAYILKREADPVAVDVGDALEIESQVRNFRVALSDVHQGDVKSTAKALSETIYGPLSSHLKGVEHLLLAPDGALNLIPVSALVDEYGDYLAKKFEVSYLTSGRDLLRFNSETKSFHSDVVVADPEFGRKPQATTLLAAENPNQRAVDLDRSGLIFRPLTETALEAADLKKLLGLSDANVLLNLRATEASLKQLHSPRVLHVASHGFFLSDQQVTADLDKKGTQGFIAQDAENPLLRSGLALAGANARHSGANDDGILTALEAAQLDLFGTQLVVLSACDSGIGEVQNGEGVYGLRRALVLAGAETQVTSLWKVSDEATRILMVDFYRRLVNGEGRSAALRHAQLAMLANPELSHPYYWASFVPIGNWAPMKFHN